MIHLPIHGSVMYFRICKELAIKLLLFSISLIIIIIIIIISSSSIIIVPATMAPLDTRPTGDQEVAGSTPAGSATFFCGD